MAEVSVQEREEREILDLLPAVTRVIAARVRDPQLVEDLTQEALTRVLAARPRLADRALAPYAVVVARNLVASVKREDLRRRRHLHRLVDPRVPEEPDESVLRDEDRRAVHAALGHLSERDRRVVVAHEVMEADTATIAAEDASTPGAVATRLARARARLRVDYLIASRRDEPATDACRPVLIALSAGDRRQQALLGAGEHIVDCAFCGELSEPVLSRRRTVAAFLPWLFGPKAAAALTRALRNPTGQITAATAAAGVAVAVFVLSTGDGPPPRSEPRSRLTVDGTAMLPLESARDVRARVGDPVIGRGIRVESVPADTGFWVGSGPGNRVFIVITEPPEQRVRIGAGKRVTFSGRVVGQPPGFAARIGVDRAEGARELNSQGAHVEVVASDISVR